MSESKGGDIEKISRTGVDVTYTVDLSSINIKDIPDLSQYKHCKSLDLSCNQISAIWKDVFQKCPHLKELKLYSNNLQEMEGTKYLQHLESLQLQYNKINSLNDALCNCKNLKFLRLDSNRFSILKSQELQTLHILSYLDISSNRVDDISSLTVLSSLKELHCTHNKLKTIPNLKSLTKLEEIDFSHNELTSVTGLKGMRSLKILYVKNNKIKCLTSVDKLKSLTELNLANNQLEILSQFPKQFPSLEILSVADNLVGKPNDMLSLSELDFLKELDIQNNPATIDASILDSLSKHLLDQLELVMYNGKNVQKHNKEMMNRPRSAMRPMSANKMISEKTISNQLQYDEMCLADFEDRIKSQFLAVQGLLEELPKSKPTGKDGENFYFFLSYSYL